MGHLEPDQAAARSLSAAPDAGPPARRRTAALAVMLALAPCGASAVDVSLQTAWMRPAAVGSSAKAYADVVSDSPLMLTGAYSPDSPDVQIIRVRRDEQDGVPVASLPIAANATTRLAYLGDHLLLADLKRPLRNGEAVRVALELRDDRGIIYVVFGAFEVRGLVAPAAPPR